jgi:hypothetical protein
MVDFVGRNTGNPKKPREIKLLGPIIKIHSELYKCGTSSHVCAPNPENPIRYAMEVTVRGSK